MTDPKPPSAEELAKALHEAATIAHLKGPEHRISMTASEAFVYAAALESVSALEKRCVSLEAALFELVQQGRRRLLPGLRVGQR